MTIPVVVFAYNRPRYLSRLLGSLKGEGIQQLIVFADGPRSREDAAAVAAVRATLRDIDWCKVELHERDENLGLGPSILQGMTEVFRTWEAALVFEDDMVIAPGAYGYLCRALEHYHGDRRVMSVTGWTLPAVTPDDVVDHPYFDGRAESWVWGSWARSWEGMLDETAVDKIARCESLGRDVRRYGLDLPAMAQMEQSRRLWAVRFLYHHLLHAGLCMRPPRSLVNHADQEGTGTNFGGGNRWTNATLWKPTLPLSWPEPVEHPATAALWRRMIDSPPGPQPVTLINRLRGIKHRLLGRRRIWGN